MFAKIRIVKGVSAVGKYFSAISRFLTEVKSELSKVIWPKREEVIRLTLVVILMSAIVALYVGGIDFGLTKALSTLLGI